MIDSLRQARIEKVEREISTQISHGHWVTARALDLLENLAEPEILSLLEKVDSLFDTWRWHEDTRPESGLLYEDENGEERRYYQEHEVYQSLVATLFYSRTQAEVKKALGIREEEWCLLFAVLALGYSACSDLEVFRASEVEDRMWSGSILIKSGNYAAMAVEAVVYAERLSLRDTDIGERLRALRSEQARRAGVGKHRKTDDLKREFAAFYGSRTFASKSKAAQLFYLQLPPEKKRFLKESNYQRTLVQSLKGL